MNFYDSDRISDLLKPLGYQKSDVPEDCDLTILNTCHIREKASEKMYSDIGRLAKLKENRKKLGHEMKIMIAGCVAQAEGKEILKRNKAVDIVVGPQNYHIVPDLIKKSEIKVLANDFPKESKFDYFPQTKTNNVSSFVTIQEGCDKFCSFCVVPFTRGAEYSRTVNEIYFETQNLINSGVREITLLGQNVNAYHGFYECIKSGQLIQYSLADLCNKLAEIDGLERIRYITSHPADMTKELINEHKTNQKLMPYLHLPIQSGSNKILKKMNRKYSKEDYIEIVDEIRTKRHDMALTSDFIVGFPGETDKDFEETLELVKKVKFAGSYSFKYSPRPGTKSSLLNNNINEKIADERLKILQLELNRQQKLFNESFVSKKLSVLFEKEGKKKYQYVGRSQYLQPVHVFANKSVVGKIFDVKIEYSESFSLHGRIC